MNFKRKLLLTASAIMISGPALAEGEHVAPLTDFAQSQVAGWMKDPAVIGAIKEQNAKTSAASQSEIDEMDKTWRDEVDASDKPMVEAILSNALSGYLKSKASESGGFVTEMFVMDARGLNVGQSDVTSDYWQGDEAKWQKTFLAGANAVFVDEVEMDESTQMLQSQVSMSVSDPETGEVIGAVTVGVNVDAL